MGKLQKAILQALWDFDRWGSRLYAKPSVRGGMTFGELCAATQPAGVKAGTHKTAVSRAVWSLAERQQPLVEVMALLWVAVTTRDLPADVDRTTFRDYDLSGTWHGGYQPHIRGVRLTSDGEDEAERLRAASAD
jgi:hypothetical protein